MKRIAILGSTGSIGSNALRVIESNPEEYKVHALAAGRNVELLIRQIEKYHPAAVALAERETAALLKERLHNRGEIEVFSGAEGFSRLVSLNEVDMVISAITGASGLMPTYWAIKAGKDIALANKETMVMAGPIVMELAKKNKVTIFPIDSEHSAIFQSLQGHRREDLKRVILTASGGPFRDLPLEKMEKLNPSSALKHPNWKMGKKVSIDSATLMNKGLEAIEARWLFDLKMEQIDILIHPESIVHSMVEYQDGSVIAQLGIPDMITPISYALSFPRHRATNLPPLRLEETGTLTFKKPDVERFKCLGLALKAADTGGSMPAALNGANEMAVEYFLGGRIGFLQIPLLIERVMKRHETFSPDSIESIIEADRWARKAAEEELLQLHS